MLSEKLYEFAAEVERHDLIGWSDKLTTDEDRWQRAAAAQPLERLLDLNAIWNGVDLNDARLHPKLLEQNLNCIA